jgi:hypothetical protein
LSCTEENERHFDSPPRCFCCPAPSAIALPPFWLAAALRPAAAVAGVAVTPLALGAPACSSACIKERRIEQKIGRFQTKGCGNRGQDKLAPRLLLWYRSVCRTFDGKLQHAAPSLLQTVPPCISKFVNIMGTPMYQSVRAETTLPLQLYSIEYWPPHSQTFEHSSHAHPPLLLPSLLSTPPPSAASVQSLHPSLQPRHHACERSIWQVLLECLNLANMWK